MSKSALDILFQERDKLIGERQLANISFTAKIEELESAIEKLGGTFIFGEKPITTIYDDDSTDYIKMSQEEI